MESATAFKDEGNVYFQHQKYLEAIEQYQAALEQLKALTNKLQSEKKRSYYSEDKPKIDSFSATLYTNIAASHLKLKNYLEAKISCDLALALNPDNWKAYLRRAEAMMHLKQYAESLENLDNADYYLPVNEETVRNTTIEAMRVKATKYLKAEEKKKPRSLFDRLNDSEEKEVPSSSIYEDDRKAIERRDKRFKIPKNFSTELLQYPCGYCDKRLKHKRNLCCLSQWKTEEHSGELEFIAWDFIPFRKGGGGGEEEEDEVDESIKVWGGAIEDEREYIKDVIWNKYGGEYRKIFNGWDNAFRWTCCGLEFGKGIHGCDHHGSRPGRRCSCDYCSGGRGRKRYIPPPTQANRLLKFNGHYGYTDWDVVRGIPWTTDHHKFFPDSFKAQVKTVLLCRNGKGSSSSSFQNIPVEVLFIVFEFMRG